MRARLAAPVLLLCLACTDADLGRVAKGLDALSISVGIFQTTVIEAEKDGFVPHQTAYALLSTALRVDQGGKEATLVVKQLQALSPTDRSNILNILAPVVREVGASIDSGLIPIADQNTRNRVRLTLLSIQSALNAVNLILAGGA